MPDSLTERPHLGQLRRRAKELRDAARRGDAVALERFTRHHPTATHGPVTLAAAQLVVARECGFASWPRLRAAVEAETSRRLEAAAFLAAAIEGRGRRAVELLRRDPGIPHHDLRAAAVLGEAASVRAALTADGKVATAVDEERGWPPLLYACYSRWHHVDPGATAGLAEVVRLLLVAGALPDTNDGGRPQLHSALKGSVAVNNPAVTEVLLRAGANPDLGAPVADAAGHSDHRCLQLLLSHGARVERTWALGAAVDRDDVEALAMLLEVLRRGGASVTDIATETLPDAAANASSPVVAALLGVGADPNAVDDNGVPAVRLAVRHGEHETAALLREAGADDDSTLVDRFLGACLNADRGEAERLHASFRGSGDRLGDRLSLEDRAAIVDAAATSSPRTIALMLDLGFPLDTRKFGDQPLHNAAYHGNTGVVRLLLDRGADVDARDDRFGATALAFATVGSGEQPSGPGDWTGTVRVLIEAGASREEAWVPGKLPSEEVAELLGRYGILPGHPGEPDGDDPPEVPRSRGSGAMAELAEHLEAAHRDRDLELLGSLLHPDVHWTGDCTSREQVLESYRALLAEGTAATVDSVEVTDDAILLELSVTGTAHGARAAPPQKVFQVFTVVDAQVVDIRGFPDRASALSRPR